MAGVGHRADYQETGCVNYDLHQGIEDPAAFYFYENWETAEQLDAHRESRT